MSRPSLPVAVLIAALALPAAASAQLPAPGPLLPPEFAAEPAQIARGPVGKYPED